jgi:acetyl xylan esterase AXE1
MTARMAVNRTAVPRVELTGRGRGLAAARICGVGGLAAARIVPGITCLADTITPPSTVFTAFNHYAGPRDIAVYPYSGHEGGRTQHFLAQLALAGQV